MQQKSRCKEFQSKLLVLSQDYILCFDQMSFVKRSKLNKLERTALGMLCSVTWSTPVPIRFICIYEVRSSILHTLSRNKGGKNSVLQTRISLIKNRQRLSEMLLTWYPLFNERKLSSGRRNCRLAIPDLIRISSYRVVVMT